MENENLPKKLKNTTSTLSKIALKVGLSSIPFMGATVNEFFSVIQERRIKLFVKTLTKDLENRKVERDFFESEDFMDVFLFALEKSTKTKYDQKIKAFANITKQAVSSNFDYDLSLTFIKFVDELSPEHIKLLQFVKVYEKNLIEIGSYQNFYNIFCEKEELSTDVTDKYKFKLIAEDLFSRVLIAGAGITDFDDTTRVILLEDHKDISVSFTSLGKDFLRYIE